MVCSNRGDSLQAIRDQFDALQARFEMLALVCGIDSRGERPAIRHLKEGRVAFVLERLREIASETKRAWELLERLARTIEQMQQ